MNTFFSLIIAMFLFYAFLQVTRIGRLISMFFKAGIKFITLGCLFIKYVYIKSDKLAQKLKDKIDSCSPNCPSPANVVDFKKYSKRKVK